MDGHDEKTSTFRIIFLNAPKIIYREKIWDMIKYTVKISIV